MGGNTGRQDGPGTNANAGYQQAESWKFPIKNELDYKGRITFRAYKEVTESLGELVGTVSSEVVDLAGGTGTGRQDGPGIPNQKTSFFGSNKFQKGVKTGVAEQLKSGTISLYLPTAIQIADSLEYANVDLGLIGGLAAAGMNAGNRLNMASFAGDVIENMGGGLMDMIKGGATSEGGQIAALRLAKGLNTEVQGAIETTTGIAINPNRRSTFRGVGIRRFQFTFKLQPTSAQEAHAIRNIVRFFRKEMYPVTKSSLLGDENLSAAYEFPSKFDIRMSYNGKKVATGLLPCFLENVNVVYNQQAMSFHKDGEPQSTDITLSFMEERTLSQKDIVGGY